MSWSADFEAICQDDAPLAPLTWYKLGGPARWLLRPRSVEELAALVARCGAENVDWRVLGKGANVLVSDAGVDGAVIVLDQPAFQACRWDGAGVSVGAGYDFPHLVREAANRGRGGLEGLAGIPGTVGGIIRMNAGGKYGFIGEVVETVDVLTPGGAIERRSAAAVSFSYRHTQLDDCVVVGAELRLRPGDAGEMTATYRRVWQEKSAEQPAVAKRSAGCIFKNPRGAAAGQLIDACGLKGARRGGAEISPRHANFIVADPAARAQDVLDLIALAKDRVADRFGVALETEIELW
jgi:UDP-N-acetylmuramate dehydrogenase